MDADRRDERKVIQLMQSESVWLQKMLFALRKAEEAWDKRSELGAGEAEPYAIKVKRRNVAVEELEDALEDRIQNLLDTVRERRRKLR